ncbi:alpha/beta hydrolase [Vibrio sp. WXL210]|uniref:alpha/beta hydrolase n=1 Tax=Vibrio sp. WXL210 TaxID=3450709 RepID=UPI003EC64A16
MPVSAQRYQIIEHFDMPQLGRQRTIRVLLPQDYHENIDRHYPVIYMHDGQNLFDAALGYGGSSWEIPDNIDTFFKDKEGVIVVGIDNGAEFEGLCRMYEYSPWQMDKDFFLPDWPSSVYQAGGEGKQYLEFITDTLKPHIDNTYRTKSGRTDTTIAGSSMGGYISLFAIMERPDVFAKAGVFSPAFWFNKPEMFNYLNNTVVEQPIQIYMDMGTQETSGNRDDFADIYLNDAKEAYTFLSEKPNTTITFAIDEGAEHTESAWAKRYPDMLTYLF